MFTRTSLAADLSASPPALMHHAAQPAAIPVKVVRRYEVSLAGPSRATGR